MKAVVVLPLPSTSMTKAPEVTETDAVLLLAVTVLVEVAVLTLLIVPLLVVSRELTMQPGLMAGQPLTAGPQTTIVVQ